MNIVTLSQTFTFDAAHTLDRSESSRRVHGHTYHAEISTRGELIRGDGMLMDLGALKTIAEDIRGELDHRLLNDVPELGAPTIENLALFILCHNPCISSVRVWRADGGACTVSV
jgi:6-pyruvoyltetrahydropterin/6-carboxytetrahydropterin synthase